MNHIPEHSEPPSNTARTSGVCRLMRGFSQNRRAFGFLSVATLITAFATLNLIPESTHAAQTGADPADSSGMMVMPRGVVRDHSYHDGFPGRHSGPDTAVSAQPQAVLKRPVAQVPNGVDLRRAGDVNPLMLLMTGKSEHLRTPLANQIVNPTPLPQAPLSDRSEKQLAPVTHSTGNQPEIVAPHPGVRYSGDQRVGPLQQAGYAPETSGLGATVESDALVWMGPYYGRTGRMPQGSEGSPTSVPSAELPTDFVAWWDPMVRHSAGLASGTFPVEVATLVQQALAHSPQVQVLQADPEVYDTIVRQEEATFDWRTFLDAEYNDLNDPVGNTLTTGNGASRFLDNKVRSAGGFRRRTKSGGEFQIGQAIGHQYNNSIFLQPNAQSTTRLELSFRQPLMSKAGTVYNQNLIVLAGIRSNVASDETLQELQTHLFSVAEAYWSLYRARAEYFQRQKLLASSQRVLQTLEGRKEVNTIPRQILRARAAVARAESRMQRAVTDIRNAESRLRLLVNDPSMLNSGPLEFTPSESPASMPSPTGLRDSLQTALVNRPDISRAIRQMRASSVRIGVSKSELLPRLDFLVTSYVAGLQSGDQIGGSVVDQFSSGRPGYTLGLEFEVPLGNRAAKAKMEQRQWELKRAISAFRVTVETSLTEVEISNREVDTAYREMLGKYQAMVAAQNEVTFLQDQFSLLPMIEDSTILLLEDLLDGYERIANEESAFVTAQTSYALSIIQLRRATGTLMRSRHEVPDLDPEESDWMTARAEQTAADIEERITRTVSFQSIESVSEQELPPAEWSRPRAPRPGGTDSVHEPNQPTTARRTPDRSVSFGGHSFGN